MNNLHHIRRLYAVNPVRVKAWGVIMGCLAVMAGVVAIGMQQDNKEQRTAE